MLTAQACYFTRNTRLPSCVVVYSEQAYGAMSRGSMMLAKGVYDTTTFVYCSMYGAYLTCVYVFEPESDDAGVAKPLQRFGSILDMHACNAMPCPPRCHAIRVSPRHAMPHHTNHVSCACASCVSFNRVRMIMTYELGQHGGSRARAVTRAVPGLASGTFEEGISSAGPSATPSL